MCPSRILAEDDIGALGLAEWWLLSTPVDPMTGARVGMPEWPFRGGFLRQPARLVDAVEIMAAEFPRVVEARSPAAPTPPAEDPDPSKVLRVNRRRRKR